jgi:fluoride ion exporter CrcB/FEX
VLYRLQALQWHWLCFNYMHEAAKDGSLLCNVVGCLVFGCVTHVVPEQLLAGCTDAEHAPRLLVNIFTQFFPL